MVNQKLISFKIAGDILPQLDSLCSEYDVNRNKMLNTLCRIGVAQLSGNRARFNILLAYSNVQF